jgi:hypothetical protein
MHAAGRVLQRSVLFSFKYNLKTNQKYEHHHRSIFHLLRYLFKHFTHRPLPVPPISQPLHKPLIRLKNPSTSPFTKCTSSYIAKAVIRVGLSSPKSQKSP